MFDEENKPKLQDILEFLVSHYGWEQLGEYIALECFLEQPSIDGSLEFLHETPWAKLKVESLYMMTIRKLD